MISLVKILNEAMGKPKAIILAGAPGAGKGYILRGLDLSSLTTYNLDLDFVPLLKKAGVSLDLDWKLKTITWQSKLVTQQKSPKLPKVHHLCQQKEEVADGTYLIIVPRLRMIHPS